MASSFQFDFRYTYICYSPAGRSVLGKTMHEVLSTALILRPRAVLKTEGIVFPNTDLPRPVNYSFFFHKYNEILSKRTRMIYGFN